MDDAVYRIVEHDGGWAYKLGDVFSETFANRRAAEMAAKRVAEEQRSPGDDEYISWEDERGVWHDEAARGADRPIAYVAGDASFAPSSGGQRPRTTKREEVALLEADSFRSAVTRGNNPSSGLQMARGQAPSNSLIVMLLTIAFAYILGIVVGRNA